MSVRTHILSFLRDPETFATKATDADVWRSGLVNVAQPAIAASRDYSLRSAQVDAWEGLAQARVGLILGPPGTGKSHLLSWLILGYVHARAAAGLPARVFISAFTRNAIGNLLDAVATRAQKTGLDGFAAHFLGNGPATGLSPLVHYRQSTAKKELSAALRDDLAPDVVVMGASVWSLYKLLQHPESGTADGFTASLFDLVCIDEASQLVLGQGLMAMGGLKEGGRLVVAGDDKQLPPIRTGRDVKLGNRELGGSLYSFLKSAHVPEFPLDETFRLNAPLAAFPERKFYPDRYRSAVEERRLNLREGWQEGLVDWEVAVLDPNSPTVVLLHDSPPAATCNSFEASTAARLADLLSERMPSPAGQTPAPEFWHEKLAIVSPHRAQNAAIREALAPRLREGAFVETVDRIQGKERDAIILSYCVADAEFAVAEADFIFAPERLNVAITRARSKLILLVSRRLLDAVPGDQEQMDKAELLREFVFAASPQGEIKLCGASGAMVQVQIRAVRFGDAPALRTYPEETLSVLQDEPATTSGYDDILLAVKKVSLASPYGNATITKLQDALATKADLLPGLASLHAQGLISLDQRSGPRGPFWVARPLDPPRRIFPATGEAVRRHTEEVISQTRTGRLPPFYTEVRKRFAWMDGAGNDVLRPMFDLLREEGVLAFGTVKSSLTVDWVSINPAPDPDNAQPASPDLSNLDYRLLNMLEDIEIARINFGVFEAWTSVAGLAAALNLPRDTVLTASSRLTAAGWVMFAEGGRLRSRMAELAREIRYVKQRFKRDDAAESPYLIRSLKLLVSDRDKPERNSHPVAKTFERVALTVDETHAMTLRGLAATLSKLWSETACLAGFQARGLEALSQAWCGNGPDTFVIAADTGSGKTEAAGLPLIAAAAADRLRGIRGVRAILAYPRIRLATNQAQRLCKYLAALAREPGMPTVTLGLQIGAVPENFGTLSEREQKAGWRIADAGLLTFPFFGCPACGEDMFLSQGGGENGADRLSCGHCDWSFGGWVGSKEGLRADPPALFLPTTDSLHQWMHDDRYGRIFGDDDGFAPPRTLLADEIHLYSHIHGAQVGYTLRRLAARAELNLDHHRPMVAIGMSATLGDPADAWGCLLNRQHVKTLTPTREEREPNPRSREYYYFIQPEVESRGHDIAGASTTIQTLMCLSHGMRRRTGREGGFRSLVFLDSIDKVRRLHSAYDDAETQRRLAAYRTRKYPDDPATGAPREGCCGEPHGCDAFRDGECWIFAAQDTAQRCVRGRHHPGAPLQVVDQPIHAGTVGQVDKQIKEADVIFATSSLEVGYDDPDITLVYQHYAPSNLASFIQRKGRGGRGEDDRPITAVTLSIYSGRDVWWFRKPERMIGSTGFGIPLNSENYFVRRGQILAATLDAFTRYNRRTRQIINPACPPKAAFDEAAAFVERIFGPTPWRPYKDSLADLWSMALDTFPSAARSPWLGDLRKEIDWIPTLLFDAINLPRLRVCTGPTTEKAEDISLVLPLIAPGNATRRFDVIAVHWRPPVQGKGPWMAQDDYSQDQLKSPFGSDGTAWLEHLPTEVRPLLADISPKYFRPKRLTMDTLGTLHGTGWQSNWAVPDNAGAQPEKVRDGIPKARGIRHESRGSLRGFPIVKAVGEFARPLDVSRLRPWVKAIDSYLGNGVGGNRTGLTLARVYWGADAELRLEGPPATSVTFTQVFTEPGSDRPLLHGYHVQTEGVRITLDGRHLDRFVADQVATLHADPPRRQWHVTQMLRFLVESGAQAAGVNAYEARCVIRRMAGTDSD